MKLKTVAQKIIKSKKVLLFATVTVSGIWADSLSVYRLEERTQTAVTVRPLDEDGLFPVVSISQYDNLFRKYSTEIGWDWKLLASLVCQESRFKPDARSRAGAYGLMQMMPATMKNFGVDTTSSPEKHIAAGVKYIKYLDYMLSKYVPDKNERIKFVLASYNIGPGHVLDAHRIAGKYGKNASIWENNVDSCLLRKTDPACYNLPEVRHGRCRGKETYAFVVQVMKLYESYKNML
ncbi:MAG: transglycosylase SLT domain-containing protein [Bacteroidales bacterium]|jgi:membrane-bound lytic murein transglycosylase F|nr:transglycosylase SLT domain-containing protein [Bacteroidales bacterium]